MKSGVFFSFATSLAALVIAAGAHAQSETVITETVQEKSPLGAEILLETEMNGFDTKADAVVTQYNFASLIYKHNERLKSALRVELRHQLFLNDAAASAGHRDGFLFADMAYTLSDSKLFANVPGVDSSYAFLRVYFPTASKSRYEDMILRIRPQFGIYGKAGVGYMAFHVRNDVFIRNGFSAIDQSKGIRKANMAMYNNPFVEVGFEPAPGLTFYTNFGMFNYAFYDDKKNGIPFKYAPNVYHEIGVKYGFLDTYEVAVYAQTLNPLGNLNFYNSQKGADAYAYLDLTATF